MKLEGQEEDLKSLKGKAGKKISLMSNYIALRCNTEGIVQYHVTYDPTVDCKFQRIRMLHQHDEHLGGTVAFDGMVLFLPKALKKEVTELVSERPTDGEKVKLTIRFIKVPKAKECLQVFNIIFRKVMSKLNMCQIGRNYYLPSEAKNIPRFNLDVWPGYVTSCGAYEAGVMLFMDVSHRVLRTQTALEIMEDLVKRNPDNAQNAIKNLLIGKAVITRYNNRLYRVDDVLWEQSPTSEFSLSNGEKITFLDYYKKSYNLDIEHHEQPLLLSIPKEKNNRNGEKKVPDMICLIPELANMTGLTEEMRTDFQMMRELAKYTKLSPTARRDSLIALCRSINKNASVRNELERWGFELDTDLYRLEGRKLPMETIKFGDSEVSAGPEADWGRAVGNNKVINAVDVQEWLFLATKRDSSKAEEFVTTYKRCAQNMGIRVSNPNLIYLHNDRTENYIAALKEGMHSKVQLVVFLFPSQRGDRYNSIKRLCCIENPVPSQVINARTISDQRKLRSVTQKIALQINCKLGGTLWSVNIPTKSIMVCGVDVNHDGKGSARRSVLAFVSSMNPECTKWYSKVKVQESSEEMASCMKVCLVDALKKYHDVNHKLPDRVVLYRDGVGDGELAMVKDFEVEQLKECMVQSGNKEFRPKLAVIVVQKRINTRLLALEMNSSDLSNPPPGTVVDHSVTKNDWYDFFVVSQHVRQGTVTPTHFVVVHDELGWNADRIQALTYKMTHLYYNWPGTVRVPAPCQYAHKLAFLVGENLKKEPHPQLNDKLFFL